MPNFYSTDLIVNSQPDLPLKVPLDKAALAYSAKVEIMKKRNIDRYENVA